MLQILLLLCLTIIEQVKSKCHGNGTRFGLPWDEDLVSLSIQRYIDAYPEIGDFNGCRRAELQLPNLATRWGYSVETHRVVTADGYILQMHRIPHERNSSKLPTNRPVVLIQHGILMSSSGWASELPEQSAAYIFADNGFDVWLGNLRGNAHAQDHIDPSKKMEEFWDFSWDEMAEFDLPAMFDTIQNVTGQEKIWYIGHSQGITIMLARLSTDSQFHKRLHAVFALAPVAKAQNVQGTIDMIMSTPCIIDSLTDFYKQSGEMQLPPFSGEVMLLSAPVCLFFPAFCSQLMFFFIGYSTQHNDSNSLVHVTITPDGISLRTAWHWKQLYENGHFEQFNYDWKEAGGNQKHYGQNQPPAYDLTKIQHTPFYVYTGTEDKLSTEADSHFLFEQLPYQVLKEHKHLENFGHIDFLWGLEAAEQIYHPIVRTIRKIEKERNDYE